MSGIRLPSLERKKRRRYVSKEEVKKLHGYKCLICGKSEKQVGQLQMAHYKAHARGGTVYIPLCPTCHVKYDKGLLTDMELKKLHLSRAEYDKYRPKRKPRQPDIYRLF